MRHFSWRFWPALCISLVLAACVVSPSPLVRTDIPLKSANDFRDYRYLELHNKLRVLLVSDSSAERAAAALDVNVGSRQDPRDYQGLAHFLEHMLFLGTEKYPEAGEYQSYINAHGGSHNAYTAFEHTNYFFDVEPQFLAPSLDRFAQFFIAPLFTGDYVDREKNAVHSEYTAKIKDEWRKASDVFKTIINQQHPFAKLSVGNLETLSDDKAPEEGALKEQLLKFYQQNYSANIMTLVVVSNDSLAELEVMVREKFSAIKNTNKKIDSIELPLFAENSLPLMVNIKPGKAMRSLTISFPTDDDMDLYRQKPLNFLGNILGHEGKGSLLSYLKKQGWSEGLSAGSGLRYQGGAMFNLTIHLTKSGVKNTDQIVPAVFEAVNAIRSSDNLQWLFEEQKILTEQQFRYQEKSSPINYASRLAASMHYYPVGDVLRAPYLITEYDQQTLNHYLSFLRPDNSLITLTAPEVETDKTSYFYHTDYSVYPVDKHQLARWNQVATNVEIHLPEPNPFIARDLSLFEDSIDNDAEPPHRLLDKPGLSMWFKSVDEFKSPKGSLYFSFNSPIASDTAEHKAKMRLLIALIADQLNELSYAATLAGLQYSLYPHGRGFSVKIDGFTSRQDLLLKKILSALEKPMFKEERFESLKSEHIRKLQNGNKKQPYQLITGELPDLLYQQSWNDQQLLAVYRDISLSKLKDYKHNMLSAGHINVLVYGNYSPEQAVDYTRQIDSALSMKPLPAQSTAVVKLKDKELSRQLESHYEDASLLVYMQARDTQKSRRAAMGVSAQIMRSEFYTSLRTEQQLGYIVSSGAYPLEDIAGLFFLVQSPVAGPAQLHTKIDQYLTSVAAQLDELTEQEFDRHRNALVSRLSEAPQNVSEKAGRYWQDLSQGYENFDFRQQLIMAMEALTYQQWLAFFVEDVIENKRRLAVYSKGKFVEQIDLKAEPIKNVDTFKAQQDYYLFPE